jgi:precorrin-4/cobalt-precorrin-4 C11-methyltransferase
MSRAKVWFVGAGPGAADLLTFRAARAIGEADIVVWARSLVMEEVLEHAREGAEIVASDELTHEQVTPFYERALREDLVVARIHSGDPAIYGAIQEQIRVCDELGLPHEIVPGVSSVAAAAASLGQELTIPETSQSLILTRRGGRTPMPEGESVQGFAQHGTTMVLFLSCSRPYDLQRELLEGGYAPDAPCAVVYRATWPDELTFRCRLDELGDRVRAEKINRQALVLIGPGLEDAGTRSHLYSPTHGHRFRRLGRPDRYPKPEASGRSQDAGLDAPRG